MTDRSACEVPTVVVLVALLLPGIGSAVAEPIDAVLEMIVPAAVAAWTATTREKLAFVAAGIEAVEHETVPLAPTAGVVHVQPAGDASETNVVFDGSGSVKATFAALFGPLLVTVML